MSARASKGMGFVIQVFRIRWLVSLLAVVIAFAIGAIFIVLADASVVDAYYAMFRGAIVDPQAPTFMRTVKPLTDSLFYAIPLIISGLGLAFGFRAGLFNIGGKGQTIVAGAAYGGIAGVLKAKTGANEVIVTIMLNSIAALALGYVLTQPAWQKPGSNQPITPNVADSAALTAFFKGPIRLHSGLIVALIALALFWWLMERSTLGFQIRAVGANAAAARTAGISVERITAVTMVISGAFLGLAGANEALGTLGYVSRDVAGSIGFDAITVALLGRNKTWGTFGAGLLFGAFKAGGYAMQAKGVPIDMILILQSVIVLLIAVPDALAVAVPAVRRRRDRAGAKGEG